MYFDLFVIVLYFVAVISIGLYKGRGDKSMEGFATGDRNIPWWAVLASILAAEISAATFLGAPGEGYHLRNFTYAQLAIGTILARIIIAYTFIKPYYDYRVVSIYEFLNIRFGQLSKNAASAVFLVTRALASGTRLYVAGVILVLAYEMYSGMNFPETRAQVTTAIEQATEAAQKAQLADQLRTLNWKEVGLYVAVLSGLTVITAIYTALGGIKAVVWTDVIQATIMFGALGFAIYLLLHQIPGGWEGAKAKLVAESDLKFYDSGFREGTSFWLNVRGILESEYTIWAAILGSTFLTMATHGTDQDMVQRMLTAKDHTRSRLALILSGLADLPIVLCFLLVGILLWVFYQGSPHGGSMTSGRVFAYYILHEMPAGMRGLLVAGIFATAMGSLSTALNALATSFTADWYVPYIRPGATERQIVSAARTTTVVFSVLLVIIGSLTAYAVIVLKSGIIPIVLGIFGYTYGSLLGVFLVGMLTRTRGSNAGNAIAMICGFVVVAILSGLHNDLALLTGLREAVPKGTRVGPEWLPVIEFPWRILFGTLVTAGVALCFRTPESQRAIVRAHLALPPAGEPVA
jgi:solute:Na+ symporter, SSS family